jgi:hypothetical protein
MQEPINRNRYDGLNVEFKRRMSNHFTVNTSYVLSRALGYRGSAANFGNAATDFNNIFASHDFGPVPNDETHRWVVSGIVSLPGGIKIAPIMQLASARPYTPTEGISDVYGFGGGQGATQAIVLNSDLNNLLGTQKYSAAQLRACLADGSCHQVNFDNLRGQTFFELDARFSKEFVWKERARLSLFFQVFDLTNRANFGANFGGNIRSSSFGTPTGFLSSAGVVVPHSFAGEFGARLSF